MPLSFETLRNLLACPAQIANCESSDDILDRLDEATAGSTKLRVLGAGRFPLKPGDWGRVRLGETLFAHKSKGKDWWTDYLTLAQTSYDPLVMLARVSLAPFTWSEGQAMLNLIGADRWIQELCFKHGMRDGFTCPIGGRWIVSFWSPRFLGNVLSSATRAALYAAASSAAVRLEQLLDLGVGGIGDRAYLTPRELAVVRWASVGYRIHQTARALGLSVETVRTHMKKAQQKLGAKTTGHAVAEAMRLRLIT